jgi:hypothetical protein
VYHGTRLLLLLVLAMTITLLFPPMRGSTLGFFEEGMVLTEPVIAEVPFTIPKSTAELQRERADAAAGVSPTFSYRPEAGDTMVVRLSRFFLHLDSVAAIGDSEILRADLIESSVVASPQQAFLLMDDTTRELLRSTSIAGVRRYAEMGVLDATEERELSGDVVLIQASRR